MGNIIRENFDIDLYGLSGVAVNQNWANMGISLTGKLWQEVEFAPLSWFLHI
jgi:hypothetical protein